MEVRELLSKYDFPGDDTPVITGSARSALEGDQSDIGVPSIIKLVDALDTWSPQPERDIDKAFLMPVEDVFSISGRGTVVTGRIERGVIKVGEEIEIVGIRPTQKTTVTGVETVSYTHLDVYKRQGSTRCCWASPRLRWRLNRSSRRPPSRRPPAC